MVLTWFKQASGSYAAYGAHNYLIKRSRAERLYYPYVDGALLKRPRSDKGFFILAEAKRACERLEAA